MIYQAKNKIRMHDTDIAGILYFPRLFRLAHDALEDLFESEGFTLERVLNQESFLFVIVHCKADYISPLTIGDEVIVSVFLDKIGNSSFTFNYEIHTLDGTLKGKAQTVHVTIDKLSRKKIPIPDILKNTLLKFIRD